MLGTGGRLLSSLLSSGDRSSGGDSVTHFQCNLLLSNGQIYLGHVLQNTVYSIRGLFNMFFLTKAMAYRYNIQ